MWKSTFFKIVIRVVLFLMVFTGAALIADLWYNRGSGRAYVELGGATLPVVYTYYGEQRLTCLPAYKQEMDPSLIRDSVVPVTKDHKVTFSVDKRGGSIGEVSYQLRDSTGETLIEEGSLTPSDVSEGISFCTAELRMDLKTDEQYVFQIKLSRTGGDLIYYTRIVQTEREYLQQYMEAAENFHALLLAEKNDAREKEIKAYLTEEAPEEYDKEDMGFVSLFSSYEALTWGEMKTEITGNIETALTEFYRDGATVVYRYYLNTVEEETQEIRTYRVDEYFVLEYVPEMAAARITDYFRRVNRQFVSTQFEKDVNGIRIGLADQDVVFMTDADNQRTVFAVDGGIWYYDYNASTLTRIYGTESEQSEFSDREGVKVLSVEEKEVYFAIYGRMSSGTHEGENGILVQRFDTEKRILTECAFITTNLPYEWLSEEAGQLLYLNKNTNMLYFLLGGQLRSLSLETGEEEILAEGMSAVSVLISRDGSVIAYPRDKDKTPGAEEIVLWDLVSLKRTIIKEDGMQLKALRFIGEDFVYGSAKKENSSLAADGSPRLYYSSLKILHRDGSQEKDYSKAGMVVSDVRFLNNTIYLSRKFESVEGSSFAEASPDFITYKLEDEKGKTILSKEDGVNGYAIVYPEDIYMTSVPESLMAKAATKTGTQLNVKGAVEDGCGYLFRAGRMMGIYEYAGTAVRMAVENRGYVVLRDGSTLYRRRTGAPYLTVADKVKYQKAESGADGYAACLTMALQMAGVETPYDTVKQELEARHGDWDGTFDELSKGTVKGLNLSGADLDTALLFLGDGIPFATRYRGRYVFVVSFNADAIRYYDPILGEEVRVDRFTFRNGVVDEGNEFYTYVK